MSLIKLNNRSIKDVTSLPFGVGNLIHISSQTASNSASISFTTGINSTYKEYQFYFLDILRSGAGAYLRVNFSTDGGSNYNVTKTSSAFIAYHDEGDTATSLTYETGVDLAQSTSYQPITYDQSTDSDSTSNGLLTLFNPSSTTYVKHYISRSNSASGGIGFYYSTDTFVAGYANTTSAINAVSFQMTSGNFSGTIAMFGVV